MTKPAEFYWNIVTNYCINKFGNQLKAFLTPCNPKHYDEHSQTIFIEAPDNTMADWIASNYLRHLEEAVRINGLPIKHFDVSGRDPIMELSVKEPETVAIPESISTKSKLNPYFTFNRFVVGPNNRMAHSAAEAVSQNPGHKYNPLFVYGGTGLGKTHLIQSVGNSVLQNDLQKRVLYTTTEDFTNEVIEAIRQKRTNQIRAKYRKNVDILLIDDIQFIANKETTQEEFFNTFNVLYNSHKQIILTSDRPPTEINGIEKRLVSRFQSGLLVDIQPPDFETRMAILREFAEREKIDVPDSIISFIAENIQSNIRDLEGCLTKLLFYSSTFNINITEISLEQSHEILKDIIGSKANNLNVDIIVEETAKFFGINKELIFSGKRVREQVVPRHVSMYLCTEFLRIPLKEIGKRYGKDHSTIIHAKKKILKMIEQDPQLKEQIVALKGKLQNR